MAKVYFGQTASGSHPPTEPTKLTSPPASGPVQCLIYAGPTLGKQWNYSGAVDGVHTFYIVDNGSTLGRQFSQT
jgi:hypothetical protein